MLRVAREVLRKLLGIEARSVEPDGFGQSIAEDIRFIRNFRRCRRSATVFRTPTADEMRAIDQDPFIGRFGDATVGLADVAGRRWIVRERDWHGWPDPPRFVFFGMDGDKVWAAADFHLWPRQWRLAGE